MSNAVKDILAAHPYSPKIKNHAIFKSLKTIDKVFPEIGLPNCEAEIDIDNSKEKQAAAAALLKSVKDATAKRLENLSKWERKKAEDKALSDARKAKIEDRKFILSSLKKDIVRKKKSFLLEREGKLTLNLPAEIKDKTGKTVFKPGERLFGVYNKLNTMLVEGKFRPLDRLEEMPAFKDFSSKNVPSNKMLVRFSSDGEEGVWDIATMSMRGITSCQTWENGNATHVVGSMVDPYTGIIYMTNGGNFNEYGSKMIRRAIVRFVVNEKTKKPYLHLEKMYPSHDESTYKVFIDFLKEKTGGKYEVKGHTHSLAGSYVPLSKVVRSLNQQDQPYRDSGVLYKNDINDKNAKLRDMVDAKLLRVYSKITQEFNAAANNIKVSDVAEPCQQSFKALTGRDYNYDYSYYYYEQIVDMVKRHIAKYDVGKYESAELLIKEAVEKLASSRLNTKIASAIKATIKSNKIPITYRNLNEKVVKDLGAAAATRIAVALKGEVKRIETALGKSAAKKTEQVEQETPAYIKFLN
jgi:hypothetical protein